MATINAYKMDGLGNDFIIIDRRESSINLAREKIIELGSRTNIGFDQIIFIEKEKENSYPITIFNSDGGEISACGNGSRCVAYLLGKSLNTKEIKLQTNNRILNAKIVKDFHVELEMGKPLLNFKDILPGSIFLDNGISSELNKGFPISSSTQKSLTIFALSILLLVFNLISLVSKFLLKR